MNLPEQNINRMNDSNKEDNIKKIYFEIKNGNKDESYPLQVINISKSYYEHKNFFNCCKKNVKTVLKNLSFENKNGECFGLLGKNGEGKSTAFKCLCQEIKPDKGSAPAHHTCRCANPS